MEDVNPRAKMLQKTSLFGSVCNWAQGLSADGYCTRLEESWHLSNIVTYALVVKAVNANGHFRHRDFSIASDYQRG